jgi:hypothetical protein
MHITIPRKSLVKALTGIGHAEILAVEIGPDAPYLVYRQSGRVRARRLDPETIGMDPGSNGRRTVLPARLLARIARTTTAAYVSIWSDPDDASVTVRARDPETSIYASWTLRVDPATLADLPTLADLDTSRVLAPDRTGRYPAESPRTKGHETEDATDRETFGAEPVGAVFGADLAMAPICGGAPEATTDAPRKLDLARSAAASRPARVASMSVESALADMGADRATDLRAALDAIAEYVRRYREVRRTIGSYDADTAIRGGGDYRRALRSAVADLRRFARCAKQAGADPSAILRAIQDGYTTDRVASEARPRYADPSQAVRIVPPPDARPAKPRAQVFRGVPYITRKVGARTEWSFNDGGCWRDTRLGAFRAMEQLRDATVSPEPAPATHSAPIAGGSPEAEPARDAYGRAVPRIRDLAPDSTFRLDRWSGKHQCYHAGESYHVRPDGRLQSLTDSRVWSLADCGLTPDTPIYGPCYPAPEAEAATEYRETVRAILRGRYGVDLDPDTEPYRRTSYDPAVAAAEIRAATIDTSTYQVTIEPDGRIVSQITTAEITGREPSPFRPDPGKAPETAQETPTPETVPGIDPGSESPTAGLQGGETGIGEGDAERQEGGGGMHACTDREHWEEGGAAPGATPPRVFPGPRRGFPGSDPRPALTLTIRGTEYGLTIRTPGRVWLLEKTDGTVYEVESGPRQITCTCPDFERRHRGLPTAGCKHVGALREVLLIDETDAPMPTPPRPPHRVLSGRIAGEMTRMEREAEETITRGLDCPDMAPIVGGSPEAGTDEKAATRPAVPGRYIPGGSEPILPDPDDIPAVVYARRAGAGWAAIAYQGGRTKHDWHYSFPTRERLDRCVSEYFASVRRIAQSKAERREKARAARASGHPWRVGEIFHNSWGYDQTQCDFYQAVAVTPGTVTLRRIESRSVPGSEGFMSDRRTAIKDAFLADHSPQRKVVQFDRDGKPYIPAEHGWMSPWDGSPKYCSWYA